ncbi:MAG: ATP-binding protein [Spirochaetes bacterium]|nr:MAG: ATP-binding protein [Spirochaetota bacterium]
MAFVSGPRQVGKTTTCRTFEPEIHYFNWDDMKDRALIAGGPDKTLRDVRLDILGASPRFIVFDELHKYGKWKTFVKGLFDKHKEDLNIVVTGSSRLDVFKKGGDSLMGRYFRYRMHPLSLAELLNPYPSAAETRSPIEHSGDDTLARLFKFGGFPEPYLKASSRFSTRWNSLRGQQLFREDLRDTSRVHELGQIELLAELLKSQTGQLTSYSSLARKVNISVDTVKRWLRLLSAVHYCYLIRPWTKNVTRSLLKEPKVFLWDWTLIDDDGARFENLIAGHLLKAVHFWTDRGMGIYELFFLRDKSGREVDFLVTKDDKPWFLVEAKLSANKPIGNSLGYFQNSTGAKHAFQVAYDMGPIMKDCFSKIDPVIVPARTFLTQLV